jgi:uncharacterized membrane protein
MSLGKKCGLCLLIVLGVLFSIIMIKPTFMSSDEGDHFARAYTLYQGKFLLDPPPDRKEGYQTGAMIDLNLIRFIMREGGASPGTRYLYYKEGWDEKIDASEPIVWNKNQQAFKVLPGAAYYLPIIYLPQAVGIAIGHLFNLTILDAYYLSTILTFLSTVIIIICAYKIFPINLFVFSLLILPVQIVQMYSPVIDSVSTALSILCISIFMRIMSEPKEWYIPKKYVITVIFSLIIIGTSRIHLAPMVLLPFMIGMIKKKNSYIFSSIVISIIIIVWSYIVAKTTVDMRINSEHSNFSVLNYFLENPGHFFKLIWDTITDTNYLSQYAEEIVIYRNYPLQILSLPFLLLVLLCGIFSVSFQTIQKDKISRLTLLMTSFISIFLVFFFLLVAWSGTNFDRIEGVMGRYFIVPLVMIGYALSGYTNWNTIKRKKYAKIFFGLLLLISTMYLSFAYLDGKNYKLYPQQMVNLSN